MLDFLPLVLGANCPENRVWTGRSLCHQFTTQTFSAMIISLLIALLIQFGYLNSPSDWDNLDQPQKDALEQRIILEQEDDM